MQHTPDPSSCRFPHGDGRISKRDWKNSAIANYSSGALVVVVVDTLGTKRAGSLWPLALV